MKKFLVSVLCCTVIMSGFTACKSKTAETVESTNPETVESTNSEIVESEASSELIVESTISEKSAENKTETDSKDSSESSSEAVEDSAKNTEAVTSETANISCGTFSVDTVFYVTDVGTVLVGTVEQGCIKMGDHVNIVLEDGTEIPATINRIEVFGGFLDEAEAGKNVGLGFEEDIAKETVHTAVSVVVATQENDIHTEASNSEVELITSAPQVPIEVFYTVELTSYNDNKIPVIKAYREITGLGLKQAKDMVELAPCVILETTNKEEVDQYKTALESAGATITISEKSVETKTETHSKEYTVELISYNDKKVSVIKAYREITGLGLKQAKDMVELAPCVILKTTNKEEVDQYKAALESAGATITISEKSAENKTETDSNDSSVSSSEVVEDSAKNTEAVTSETANISCGTFSVDTVFYVTDVGTVLVGTVEQGCIKMGDHVNIVLEDGTEIPATINRIEVFGGFLDEAEAGKNVGLGFEEDITKETVHTAVSVTVVTQENEINTEASNSVFSLS